MFEVRIFIGDKEVQKEDIKNYEIHSDVLNRILAEKKAGKEKKHA